MKEICIDVGQYSRRDGTIVEQHERCYEAAPLKPKDIERIAKFKAALSSKGVTNEDREKFAIKLDRFGRELKIRRNEMPIVLTLAEKVTKRAFENQEATTSFITGLSEKYGAQLVGLKYKLKGIDSTQRKIITEMLDNGWSPDEVEKLNIGDALRYTMVIDPEEYSNKVSQVLADIGKENEVYKIGNTWDSLMYRGINTNYITSSGAKVELQIHTPESFRIKDTLSHDLYEEYRDEATDSKTKGRLQKELAAIWSPVEQPKGFEKIVSFKSEHLQIKVHQNTKKKSAPEGVDPEALEVSNIIPDYKAPIVKGKTVMRIATNDPDQLRFENEGTVKMIREKYPDNYVRKVEQLVADTITISDPNKSWTKNTIMYNSGFADKIKSASTLDEKLKVADEALAEFKKRGTKVLNRISEVWEGRPVEISEDWYEGANRITQALSKEYGITIEQGGAGIAVMSPGTEWFTNLARFERTVKIHTGHGGVRLTAHDMKIIGDAMTKNLKDKGGRAKSLTKQYLEIHDSIIGKNYDDLSISDKAKYIFAYDMTRHKSFINEYTPDGELVGIIRNKDGSPSNMAWSPFGDIEKAVSIIEDGSPENISQKLGEENKIRNFANNQIDPTDLKSLTVDTHAVAAVQGNTYNSMEASAVGVFSNSGQVKTNIVPSLVYAVYQDIYIEEATRRGVVPRSFQSSSWEGVRLTINNDSKKIKGLGIKEFVNDTWAKLKEDGSNLDDIMTELLSKKEFLMTDPSWMKKINSRKSA